MDRTLAKIQGYLVRKGQGQNLDRLDGEFQALAFQRKLRHLGSCAHVELGRKHKITGTPTMLFADNSRVPGAISSDQVEKYLSAIK